MLRTCRVFVVVMRARTASPTSGDAIFLIGNIVGAGKAPPCTDAATLQSVPPARRYFVVTANDLSGNESCFSTEFFAVVWVFD